MVVAVEVVRCVRTGATFPRGVTTCAVRSTAVPVWRPAFQAVRAMRQYSPTRSAGLQPAGRLKPAFQAVRVTSAVERHGEAGTTSSGGVTTCAVRSTAVPVWRPAFQAGAPPKKEEMAANRRFVAGLTGGKV